MKLQRWSLKSKLLASFGVLTMIVFIVGAVDFFIIHRISRVYNDIVQKDANQVMVIFEMSSKVAALDLMTRDMQLSKDQNNRVALAKKIHMIHEDYRKLQEVYESTTEDGRTDETYLRIKKAWTALESSSDKVTEIFLSNAESSNSDFNQIWAGYQKANEEFVNSSQKLVEVQKKSISVQIAMVNETRKWSELISLTIILIGIFLPMLLGYFFSKNISQSLHLISNELNGETNLLRGISSEMAASSNSLSSSTSAQAAALQETMSAVSEMGAMISRNSENSNSSQKESENSSEAANRGQEAVRSMLGSVQEIEESNRAIMGRIETSHREMSEMVGVINEIASKTKVINEIVFQTKLLSFNASVEAARAGEHGKGFAVVAEEVGNLAQMSGNAAKEITQLLDHSVVKVETLVKRTREEVEAMMDLGSEKVRKGIEGGQRCGAVLGEIVTSVKIVNSMLVEIAKASAEQATGVHEIENAMNQLDEITQNNNASANLQMANSENLKTEANKIAGVVEELDSLLNGVDGPLPGAHRTHLESNFKEPMAPAPVSNVFEFKQPSKFEFKPFHTIASTFESKVVANTMESEIPDQNDKRFEDV